MRIYSIMPTSLLLALLFLFAPAPAKAGDCGGENQILCGGGCTWYMKWVLIPWCYQEKSYCLPGFETVTRQYDDPEGYVYNYQRCTASAVPPPPAPIACDAACQAQKINAALGNPDDASLNRSVSISRAQAGIPDSAKVVFDIGGEGHHRSGSRCNLSAAVVNINPAKTTYSGAAIPNLVLAYAQKLPFGNAFADQVSAESVPFDANWGEEMARVVKPGGKLAVCGQAGSSFNEGINQLSAHGLIPTATNNFALNQREVVFNVSPFYTYAAVALPASTTCAMPLASRQASINLNTGSTSSSSTCTIDMAVFYTNAAQAEATAAGSDMQAVITTRIAAMNTALSNTGVTARVRAVHTGPTSYDENLDGKDMQKVMQVLAGSPLKAAGNNAAVDRIWAARKALGADLVSVFVSQTANVGSVTGSVCGIGSDILVKTQGYSVLRWICSASSEGAALAHEAGHNLGLHHDRYADGKAAGYDPTGYNYGYVSLAGNGFWTIMGYAKQCSDNNKSLCSRIPYYSSPLNLSGGVATGAANADNKRAITENAPIVAGYYPTAAALAPAPKAVDFEGVLTSTTAPSIMVTVYNTATTATTISSVSVANTADGFSVGAASTCKAAAVVAGTRACDVELKFAPGRAGRFSTNLNVAFVGGSTVSVPVKGEGMANVAELALSASFEDIGAADPIPFGNVVINTPTPLPLSFSNNGPGVLSVSNVTLSGSAAFTLVAESDPTNSPCIGFPNAFSVPGHGWCRAYIQFLPTASGNSSTTMTIRSNDPATPVRTVTITGWGVKDEL